LSPDLETRILNRLQDRKLGQTVAQLKTYLNESRESVILSALHKLLGLGQVKQLKYGVWKLADPKL
jgi:hypothetical protein